MMGWRQKYLGDKISLVEIASVAQRIEHLSSEQGVGGSSPSRRTLLTVG